MHWLASQRQGAEVQRGWVLHGVFGIQKHRVLRLNASHLSEQAASASVSVITGCFLGTVTIYSGRSAALGNGANVWMPECSQSYDAHAATQCPRGLVVSCTRGGCCCVCACACIHLSTLPVAVCVIWGPCRRKRLRAVWGTNTVGPLLCVRATVSINQYG